MPPELQQKESKIIIPDDFPDAISNINHYNIRNLRCYLWWLYIGIVYDVYKCSPGTEDIQTYNALREHYIRTGETDDKPNSECKECKLEKRLTQSELMIKWKYEEKIAALRAK